MIVLHVRSAAPPDRLGSSFATSPAPTFGAASLVSGCLAALLFVLALGGWEPAVAQDSGRSFSISVVDVVARVNPDATMDVVERLTYDFDGEFNGGTREITPGPWTITGFRVSEDGETRDLAAGFDDPNAGEVRWFGSASHDKVSGEHTYELAYRVDGAVAVAPDAAVLNWQFVGTGFPELGRVAVAITLPGDGTGVRAFAHGDLRGVVEPVGNTVFLRVVGNPAGAPVEARVLVPPAAFVVTPSGPPVLDAILAEEGRFADEANAARADAGEAFAAEVARGREPGCDEESSPFLDRRCAALDQLLDDAASQATGEPLTLDDADVYFGILQARQEIRDEVDRIRRERNASRGNIAAPVVAVVVALAWFAVWRRWGKEPPRPADIGDYWREVPAESPAVVASIDDWGVVDSKAFAATVVDLAQRGWLTISEEDGTHRFTRSQQTTDELPLRDYETQAMWRLFEGGRPTVTQDELVDEAKDDRTASAEWMTTFKAAVKADYDAQGFQARQGCLPWLLHLTLLLVAGLTAAVAFALRAWIGAGIATGVAAVLLALTGLLRRRTATGARKHAEVKGLKAFLRDFSLVDDVPVGHLALYERYLVYAVALGVAERLVAALRMRFPELAQDQGFAAWYVPIGAGRHDGAAFDRLDGLGSVGGFARDFSHATASAFSPPSSSSGGGGGFSGGSSGGGGGGSAGAW